jgi:hypothetical protein
VTTISVLLKCTPFFVAVGTGLYVLLSGILPSWRDKDWTHWKIYDTDEPIRGDSWLVSLGWVKPTKPVAEGKFDQRTAIWVHCGLGTFLVLIGLGGIVWILLSQLNA